MDASLTWDVLRTVPSGRAPLEDELIRLLDANVPSPRDRQVVARVLGWDGQGGCLLAQAGEEAGITRERARQVYDRAAERIRGCKLSSSLDEVLAFVRRRRNRAEEDIQGELQLRRLTNHKFGMQALIQTARLFGRTPGFTLEETGGKRFVVTGAGVVGSILKAALRSSSRFGVQTVREMCVAIPPGLRTANDRLLIRQILGTRNDLRWLDDEEQWFYLASVPRNPIVACIKKLLSFASPVSPADIERATRRLPRKRKTPIPRAALIGLCRDAPFCRMRNGSVELVAAQGAVTPLDGAEGKVCRLLKRHGNELAFECLASLCESAGVTRANLWRIVLHSPLIYRKARKIYRLVTAQPPGLEPVSVRTA
jgi:hypothetical protein